MAANKSLMLMQVAIGVGLPANVISWFLMATMGRRTIILWSTLAVGLLWLASGIAGCFPSSNTALLLVIHNYVTYLCLTDPTNDLIAGSSASP
jgi:hypothetical protein